MRAPAKHRLPALTAILALAAASLSACGSSGAGLIPAGNAGPLQEDFQRVAEAATEGYGDCVPTEKAIERTERDFERLPSSVDKGLRERLSEGIGNLRVRALEACKQPNPASTTSTTSTTTSKTSTTTSETMTETEATSSESTEYEPPTSTIPTESGEGGGTEAPTQSEELEEPGEEEAGENVP